MSQSKKKTTNLSINKELIDKARALKINLSATLEESLKQKIRAREQAQWRQENARAITAYNEFVEQHGLFADSVRRF